MTKPLGSQRQRCGSRGFSHQFIISCMQRVPNGPQLTGLDVLCASFDFYQRLSGHILSHQLQSIGQRRLSEFLLLSNSADICANANFILLDFLFFHRATSTEPILVLLPFILWKWRDIIGPKQVHSEKEGTILELAIELLAKLLAHRDIHVTFPGLNFSAAEMLEAVSYQALCEIQRIIRDDTLSDAECFQKIEEIVCTFEKLGSNGGSRHDFG